MKINVAKKTAYFAALIVTLVAIVGVLLRQNNVSSISSGHMGQDMSKTKTLALTSADIMFLQMMIPHHQQAIDMSQIALTNSQNPELLSLAKNIAAAQGSEIVMMQNWLAKSGAGGEMGHMGHDMGGMLGDDDLKKLQSSTGKEFDKLWLQGMVGHHDGAIDMVEMIKNAKNVEVKEFGVRVIADQTTQIEQMKKMLAQF